MRKYLPYTLAGLLACGVVPAIALTQGQTAHPLPVVTASESEQPLEPDEVTDLTIKWNILEGGFDISFTTPKTGSYYDYNNWSNVTGDLTSIEKIEVYRYMGYNESAILLHTFDNPGLGEKISYRETSLEKGKKYDFQVKVFANGEESYGATCVDVLAGAVPGRVTDVAVSTDKGQMPVTVSFTAPATYAGSDVALELLDKIELTAPGASYWDPDVVLETVTDIAPGERHSLTINLSGVKGSQTWKLAAYNESGVSETTDVKIFIGEDTPGEVGNFKAVEQADGNVLLTWDAPTAGANNGYFDASNITYTVIQKIPGETSWSENSTVLIQNLTECSYLHEYNVSEPTKLRFAVKATSQAGAGVETNSGYIILGPALEFPFTEGFNSVSGYTASSDHLWGTATNCPGSYSPEWKFETYTYVGNVQVKPESGEGGLAKLDSYTYTPVSDFWLVSSKINVAGEAAVELGFCYYAPETAAGKTGVGAEISFDNGATYTPVCHAVLDEAPQKGWNKLSGVVAVPSSAENAIIRIVANNDPAYAVCVVVDEISLRSAEAPAEVYPASVTDFSAVMDKDNVCIDVTLTAPEKSHPSLGDVNNEPLARISCIKLFRQIGYANDYMLVHTFDNPAPGATLTYKDTDLTQGGEYRYRAVVYVGDLCDYGNYTDDPITVGQKPSEVTDLKASSTQGAAPVVLTFRAPATDIDGNKLNAINAIVATRCNNETFEWEEIGRLTDNLLPGEEYSLTDANVASATTYEYRVTVEGTAGNSYGVTCQVYVGNDQPLSPSNLKASVGEDGKVVVSWDAPTEGLNGGYIDTDHLTYIIQRGNGYSDYDATLLVSGHKGTTFTDPTEFDEEEIVKYFVKAVSNGMAGYSAISNTLVVGRPSELPFIENFDNVVGDYIQADHSSWTITSSEESGVWAFAEMAYFINEGQVLPVDGGNGLAYAYYGHYSSTERDDYLTSGNIDVTGATAPQLTFNVYGVPGYGHSLDVEASFDGDDFTSIQKFIYYIDFDEEGWHNIVLPINKPADAEKLQIRFHAHKAAYSCSVAIDNIRVDGDGSGVAQVTPVQGVMVASVNGSIVVTGASAGEVVTVADTAGRVVYSGTGDCTVAVAPATYIVRVDTTAVKLLVK
ncbi:MAG: fibronectin type III domain-containing protein [Bacteroidales bacterium]|nr:fibronectin type III domain-containing protein [Bacteroidales bacterium]